MSEPATEPQPPPTPEEVGRIVAIGNPVLRNLEITHCYARLSAAMTQRTGRCANWCTFATWASRQAGRTIRGEDLIETLRARLHQGPQFLHPLASLGRVLLRKGLFDPQSRLGRVTAQLHTPFDVFERTSEVVARGNRKVFEEIGLEFARYLQEVPPDAGAESPALLAFLDGLRPGEPPDGQRLLRQAFTRYAGAAAPAPDEPPRAQQLLLANLEIGMHEQTRLQPEIRESLDAPYAVKRDLGERLVRALLPWWRRPVPRVMAAPIGAAGARARRGIADLLREIITRSLTVLSLPGRVLHLGENIDEPNPPVLAQLTDPELTALLQRVEPAAPLPDDAGARDWSDFDQRMHYIAHLFRAFHVHDELLGAPFTNEQIAQFSAGTVPDGMI